jgi:hypothetical protein
MDTHAVARPRAIQTHIGLLPGGRSVVVCYLKAVDALLCEQCEQCTARPARLITGRCQAHPICVQFVDRSSLYAECFG